jgi:hypothetical protein
MMHVYFASSEKELVLRFPTVETVYESLNCPALILRNESVIDVEITGKTVLYFFENGENVGKSTVVANVYPDRTVQSVVEEIYGCRKRIKLYTEVISGAATFTLTELNKEISELNLSINRLMTANDTVGIQKLQDRLIVLIGIRDIKVGGDTTKAEYHQKIENLEEEIDKKILSLGNDYVKVTSDKSGYFFRGVDGYEGRLSVSNIEDLTTEQIFAAFNDKNDTTDYLGKIVNGYEWYTFCTIPSENISDFTVGKSYGVGITNEKNFDVQLKLARSVYSYGDDVAVLIFVSDRSYDGFDYSRLQYAEVRYDSHTGYIIPRTAVRYKDGVAGVYCLYGYRVVFREISPTFERDGLIIVDTDAKSTSDYRTLSYYDNMILKGFDLYVGKIIE